MVKMEWIVVAVDLGVKGVEFLDLQKRFLAFIFPLVFKPFLTKVCKDRFNQSFVGS